MGYLTKDEMYTHIYEEDIDAISHGDDYDIETAIATAIDEATSYLVKYDYKKIFSARGKDRSPMVLSCVKDITAWHFCIKNNAGVDIELMQTRYEKAIEWLKNNQNKNNPTLPVAVQNTTGTKGNCHMGFDFGSNRKRDNHF